MKSGGSHMSLSPISLCEFAIGPWFKFGSKWQ
jgi:hypothetical protein